MQPWLQFPPRGPVNDSITRETATKREVPRTGTPVDSNAIRTRRAHGAHYSARTDERERRREACLRTLDTTCVISICVISIAPASGTSRRRTRAPRSCRPRA
jgi:hypothetical protein